MLPRYPRLAPENLEVNAKLVKGVADIAKDKGLSTAQLSLAWVACQGGDVCPIPGTTKIAHFNDNVAARNVTLSADEMATIAMAVPVDSVAGMRFSSGDAATYKSNI